MYKSLFIRNIAGLLNQVTAAVYRRQINIESLNICFFCKGVHKLQ